MQFQRHIGPQVEIDPHVETRFFGFGLLGTGLGRRDAAIAPGTDGEGSDVVVDAFIAALSTGRLATITGLDLPQGRVIK